LEIENNMREYYNSKVLQKVITDWRGYLKYANKTRIDSVTMRASFIDRPYLAKPLLMLRNQLQFKAFKKLLFYARYKKYQRANKEISTFAFYLRLQRKCFYSLRLNAAARYQTKKSK
jgi:hypothetical protein